MNTLDDTHNTKYEEICVARKKLEIESNTLAKQLKHRRYTWWSMGVSLLILISFLAIDVQKSKDSNDEMSPNIIEIGGITISSSEPLIVAIQLPSILLFSAMLLISIAWCFYLTIICIKLKASKKLLVDEVKAMLQKSTQTILGNQCSPVNGIELKELEGKKYFVAKEQVGNYMFSQQLANGDMELYVSRTALLNASAKGCSVGGQKMHFQMGSINVAAVHSAEPPQPSPTTKQDIVVT